MKFGSYGNSYRLQSWQFIHRVARQGTERVVDLCYNGRGRKLMHVNRMFHYRLLGLRSASCNEDESYNSEAAGRSFVLQYTHII